MEGPHVTFQRCHVGGLIFLYGRFHWRLGAVDRDREIFGYPLLAGPSHPPPREGGAPVGV